MPGTDSVRGTCHPLYIFEIGQLVDLEGCERRIQDTSERLSLKQRGRLSHFQYRPPPLRVTQQSGVSQIGPFPVAPTVELVIYGFGAISVGYAIPIEGPLDSLVELSIGLRARGDLVADARSRVTALVASLGALIVKPKVAEIFEDYVLFEVQSTGPRRDGAEYLEQESGTLARILRAERGTLSEDEIRDAMQATISFGVGDLSVIDYDTAFVLDPEPDEVRAVLEVANVQLLEMRYLDQELDQALQRSYALLARQGGLRTLAPGVYTRDLDEVAELQLDSAMLLERVTNALKFFGEEFPTRIYRLAAQRFHLGEWDQSISRKLSTIESLYQKLAARASGRRMELLEWVVIILIAMEIVLSFLPGH
ncbi:MAG TPA: hypothetical protein VJN95_01250 [Gemmatimonadales bacterium]|nr:hypothetical protein [Gemmatimonadales bacterium]